jgi:hypothetical protein
LNTYIQVRNDSVHLRAGEFVLENARIFDREGNTGRVSGALRHTHLKNLTYHFNIHGDNLLMYDTNDPGDMLFYGKVYGTGNITLAGGNNAMNIDVNLATSRNTTFTYVTGLTAEATNTQFITFVDKTPKRLQDSIQTQFYHYTDALKATNNDGPPMDLRINMLIDANPEANMRIIMDPVSGDYISARGNGNFRVSYYNKGDFRMDGYHHDGHNYYLYRRYRDGVSSEDIEDFQCKILDHTLTEEDIDRVTVRLGDDIAKIYGFTLPDQAKNNHERSDAR